MSVGGSWSPLRFYITTRGECGAPFWVIVYWKDAVKDRRRVAKSVAMLEVLIYE